MKRHTPAASSAFMPLRLLLPFIVMGLVFLLNLTVLPLPVVGSIKPPLLVMVLYYWAIYHPTLVPPWLCFVLGVFMDFLMGLPPGINAMLFVAIQWLGQEQRRFLIAQPYITIWAVFGLMFGIGSFVQWGLYGLMGSTWTPIAPVVAQILIGVFLFPFVSVALVGIHRLLPKTNSDYR